MVVDTFVPNYNTRWSFPGGTSGKENLPADAEVVRDVGLVPGSGRSSGGGHGNPPVFLPGESYGQRSLEGYSPRDRKELDTPEATQHPSTCNTRQSMISPVTEVTVPLNQEFIKAGALWVPLWNSEFWWDRNDFGGQEWRTVVWSGYTMQGAQDRG